MGETVFPALIILNMDQPIGVSFPPDGGQNQGKHAWALNL